MLIARRLSATGQLTRSKFSYRFICCPISNTVASISWVPPFHDSYSLEPQLTLYCRGAIDVPVFASEVRGKRIIPSHGATPGAGRHTPGRSWGNCPRQAVTFRGPTMANSGSKTVAMDESEKAIPSILARHYAGDRLSCFIPKSSRPERQELSLFTSLISSMAESDR
jgi:hypothetical protein